LLAVGLAAAGVLGFLAYRKGHEKTTPPKVVRCKVAEMREGVCRVKGRLVAREPPLTSPFTNKECVFFRFKVEQAYEVKTWRTSYNSLLVLSGANESTSERETWQTLIDDTQHVAVALEDETGKAYLDLGDAQLDVATATKEGVIDTSREDGVRFDLMLQKRYHESTLVARRRHLGEFIGRRSSSIHQGRELPKALVREEVVENGVEVIVVGEVETREGGPPRFRPVNHPLIVTTKAKRASLPTPGNPATGYWISAGIVLGATLLLFLFSLVAVCAGFGPPGGPRLGPPPPVWPAPGR
jgi:hypothetical protein